MLVRFVMTQAPLSRSDHPLLYKSTIYTNNWQWIWANAPPASIYKSEGFKARVQFRHRMADVGCTVRR
jgi:tRNA-5-taurinomethyluridine 2-sulfurtransferase